MFSISKNDVSEFLKKEKNTNEFYGSFFSFFPLPMIHLVIPMESRELGATSDLALLALHSHSCSLLLLHTVLLHTVFLSLRFSASSNHPNISTNSFCTLWPLSLLYQFCNSIFCFSKSAFSALSCS